MENKKDLKKITIKVPEHIQLWYKEQGEKYSVPYSNYMVMMLTQIYENEKNKELVKELNDTLKILNTTTGNVTAEEMLIQFKEMISKINELEK